MPNYLDELLGIDAKGDVTPILLQDRETLAYANQINAALGNEIGNRIADDQKINTALNNETANRIAADQEINEKLDTIMTNYHYFEEFGAKGDGVTDDSDAIISALASNYQNFKLLAGKTYLVSKTLNITHKVHITAEEQATIKCADNSYLTMNAVFRATGVSGIELDNFIIDGNWQNNIDYGNPDASGNLPKHYAGRVIALIDFTSCSYANIHDMVLTNSWTSGIWLSDCPYSRVESSDFVRNRIVSIAIRNNTSVSTLRAGLTIVTGNTIDGRGVLGIETLFGTSGISITNNFIENCNDTYKFPSWAFNGTYPNVYPKDNRFNTPSDSGYITPAMVGDGACIEGTGKYTDPQAVENVSLSIANNICKNAICGIRLEELSQLTAVSSNSISDCQEGVFIYSANNISCSSNAINHCLHAIRLDSFTDPAYNIAIDGNVIENNTEFGIEANGNNVIVSNNILSDNPVGIYSLHGLANSLILGNVFAEIRAGSTNSAIDLANIEIGSCRISNNDFNVPTPIGGTLPANGMKIFDNNVRWATKQYGVADIDSTLTKTVSIAFPIAPDSGQLQITPITADLHVAVTSITANGFTVTSDIAGTFNWSIDFNANV